MSLDDRIRAGLGYDESPSPPAPGFVERVAGALPAKPVRRPWGGRWSVVYAAVAVVVLAGVLVIVGPLRALVGPTAVPSPGASTASPGATASPDAVGGWTHLSWVDVSGAVFDGTAVTVRGGLSWQGGYLLYGEDVVALPTGVFGLVWVSPDGYSWQRVPASYGPTSQVPFADASVTGAAARGDTLVVVGQLAHATPGTSGIAIWTSGDGLHWTEDSGSATAFASLEAAGVVAGRNGFVVYGTSRPVGQAAHPTILYSADGTSWASETVPDARAGDGVTSVVATADGFAAVGGPVDAPTGTGILGAAWWSLDGQIWHPGAVDAPAALGRLGVWPGGELRALSSARSSCSVCLGLPSVITWSSADGGRTWRRLAEGLPLGSGDTTVYDAGRLVRLQTQGSPWATWSSDAVTWAPLRMDGATPAVGSELVVADGSTLIATRQLPNGRGGSRTGVFVGQLDDQPGPVPTPTLVPGSHDTPCLGTNPCGP